MFAGQVMLQASESSHIPRPCVAMRKTSVFVFGCAIAISNTATTGKPVPSGAQFVPPSVEEKTPMSVPANKLLELTGSTANEFTGTLGMTLEPVPGRAVHTGVVFKFVTIHT